MRGQCVFVVHRVVNRRRKQVRTLVPQPRIPLRRRVLHLVHRQRLHHVDAQRCQVLHLFHHVEKRRRPAGRSRRISSNMQLIHHHVRVVRRLEPRIMPRIRTHRSDHRRAHRKRRRRVVRQLARVRIALIPARSRTHHVKSVGIALGGLGDKPRPIAARVPGHQQVRRLPQAAYPTEDSVQIHRRGPRSPRAKSRAPAVPRGFILGSQALVGEQCRAHWCRRGTVRLRDHPSLRLLPLIFALLVASVFSFG